MRLPLRRPRPRAYCSSAVVQGKALAQRRRREKQKRVAKWQHDEDEALWDLLADPEVEEVVDAPEPCIVCFESVPLMVLQCPGSHGLHRMCFTCLQGLQSQVIADPWGSGALAVGLTEDGRRVPIFALKCPFRCGVFCNAVCPVRNATVGFALVVEGWY